MPLGISQGRHVSAQVGRKCSDEHICIGHHLQLCEQSNRGLVRLQIAEQGHNEKRRKKRGPIELARSLLIAVLGDLLYSSASSDTVHNAVRLKLASHLPKTVRSVPTLGMLRSTADTHQDNKAKGFPRRRTIMSEFLYAP